MAAYDLRPNRIGQITVPRTQGATNLANFMRLEQDRRNAADRQRLEEDMLEWKKGAQDRADQRTLDINKNVADQMRAAEQGLIESFAFDEDARNKVFQSKQFQSLPPEVQAEMRAEGYFKNRLGKDINISELVGANQYEQALRDRLANTRLGVDAQDKVVKNILRQKGLSRTGEEINLLQSLLPSIVGGVSGYGSGSRRTSRGGDSSYEKRDRLGNPNVGMKLDQQLSQLVKDLGISNSDPFFDNLGPGSDDVSQTRLYQALSQYVDLGFNPSTFSTAIKSVMEDDAELQEDVNFNDFMRSLSNPPPKGKEKSDADRLARRLIEAGKNYNREELSSGGNALINAAYRSGTDPRQLLTSAMQWMRPQAATSEDQAKLLLSLLPQVQAAQQQQQPPAPDSAPAPRNTQPTTENTTNVAPQGNSVLVPSEQPKSGVLNAGLDFLIDAAIPGSVPEETQKAIKNTARGVQDAAYKGLNRDLVPNLNAAGLPINAGGRIFNVVDEIRNQYGDDINQLLERGQQTGSDVLNTLMQAVQNVPNVFGSSQGRMDELDINAVRLFPKMNTGRLRSLLAKFEGLEGYEKQVAQLKKVLASRQ